MSDQEHQSERMKFAALVAHQLKGPVATASMLLKTLLGEFSGPLNTQQKDILTKAIGRLDQAFGIGPAYAGDRPGGRIGRPRRGGGGCGRPGPTRPAAVPRRGSAARYRVLAGAQAGDRLGSIAGGKSDRGDRGPAEQRFQVYAGRTAGFA